MEGEVDTPKVRGKVLRLLKDGGPSPDKEALEKSKLPFHSRRG